MSLPLYFRNSKIFKNKARIFRAQEKDENSWEIVLDQTCCYPKGGGQPGDKGLLVGLEFSGKIENAYYDPQDSSYIIHKVLVEQGEPKEGDEVEVIVDEQQRQLHTRLHSAGHVIDAAVEELGLMQKLLPIKGSHYPEMTYVFYEAAEKQDCNQLKDLLQQKVDLILAKDLKVFVEFENDNQQDTKCQRYVTIQGYAQGPCGGTHVEKLSEIGKIIIGKIAQKKSELKVAYKINF